MNNDKDVHDKTNILKIWLTPIFISSIK